jgi:hypothetical protein
LPYRITFVVDTLADPRTGEDVALGRRALRACLGALTACDVDYLRGHPEVPALRTSDVYYRRARPPEVTAWQDVPSVLSGGVGHREDLACWRAAELRVRSRSADWPVLTGHESAPDGRVPLVLGAFPPRSEHDRQIAHKCIEHCLRALTLIDEMYLRAHPEVPPLYTTGVRYEEEPPGQEDWQDVRTTLKKGVGDCEDLACWRAAELRVRDGVDAWPTYLWRARPRGGMLYHIQTEYPDGRVEDPSRRLGMR